MTRALLVLLLAAGAARAGDPLPNGSFEAGLEGWERWVGAQLGAREPESRLSIDREVARDGKASLRFEGDAKTMHWWAVGRTASVDPGQRVLLRVAARSRGLLREGRQYRNANALLLFRDASGRRLGLHTSPVLRGDRDWVDLHVHAFAPEGAAAVHAAVFSSMSGTAWFDDVRLRIASADPDDRDARALAYEALRAHMAATYPFFGLAGKPELADLPAPDPANDDVVGELRRMLLPLRDVHVWICTARDTQYVFGANPNPRNWNLGAIWKRLDPVLRNDSQALCGRIGDVGYLMVKRWQGHVAPALEGLKEARALVIDVRPNGGGDEGVARLLAGRFAEEETVYAYWRLRDPTTPSGFGPAHPRKLGPAPGGEPDRRPVVVLQGPFCASSTEGFLLMMRALGKRTVGLPSRGASANPRPFPLFPGVDVHVSTSRSLDLGKRCIEGRGIEPDVRVDGPHTRGDPTLARALELLR